MEQIRSLPASRVDYAATIGIERTTRSPAAFAAASTREPLQLSITAAFTAASTRSQTIQLALLALCPTANTLKADLLPVENKKNQAAKFVLCFSSHCRICCLKDNVATDKQNKYSLMSACSKIADQIMVQYRWQ
jgi:hypothetical protein